MPGVLLNDAAKSRNPVATASVRPRVLHVFSTFAVGGPQKRFALIANETWTTFHHHVLAADDCYEARGLLDVDSDIAFLPCPSRCGNVFARILQYRSFLRHTAPDVLATYNWGTVEWALAARFTNVPHVHFEDGFGPDEVTTQLLRRVVVRRLFLSQAQAVVVPSRKLERIALEVWRLPPARVRLIQNGISVAQARGGSWLRREFQIEDSQLIVGWVGALRAEKNLGRLLRAFKSLDKRAVLVLVGDGPERDNTLVQIEQLGLGDRVRVVGMRLDIGAILKDFDILALSSDTEQLPMAILEGMAAGRPIAATGVGDLRATVSRENLRYIVEPTDEALASALSELAASASLRATVGAANQRHVEVHFPLQKMIKAHTHLIQEAISKSAGRDPAASGA